MIFNIKHSIIFKISGQSKAFKCCGVGASEENVENVKVALIVADPTDWSLNPPFFQLVCDYPAPAYISEKVDLQLGKFTETGGVPVFWCFAVAKGIQQEVALE